MHQRPATLQMRRDEEPSTSGSNYVIRPTRPNEKNRGFTIMILMAAFLPPILFFLAYFGISALMSFGPAILVLGVVIVVVLLLSSFQHDWV